MWKLWNMKVVVGALGTVFKELERWMDYLEIRGRIETILNEALWNTEKSPGDVGRLAFS